MPHDETLQQISTSLATIPYFAPLAASLREVIARQVKAQQVAAGQVVILEGDQPVSLYIVQSGWLKAVKTSPDGREQILDFISAGQVFNAVGVFVESANPATVIALESATLWVIPQAVMLRLLDDYPPLGRAIIQDLAQRVQKLVRMVEDLSLRSLEARLARYLLEQAKAEQVARPRWATQAEMANRLGTVPDVLHRTLRGFAKEGLIQVKRQRIHILDEAGLAAKAGVHK